MEEGDQRKTMVNGFGPKPTSPTETLCCVVQDLTAAIVHSDGPLLQRLTAAFAKHGHRLRPALRKTGTDVIDWARRGSPLRFLLLISAGVIIFLAMAGLLVFTLFFVVATINAVIISLLASLAVAAGVLAVFFACLATIYIGVLLIAGFVISTVTVSVIIATLITTGWIGLLMVVWLATTKILSLFKRHRI